MTSGDEERVKSDEVNVCPVEREGLAEVVRVTWWFSGR